ncbi:MAG: ATP-binding cassette domain-containing protein [Rhodospirillaceae bacterium]|nr:ATP-binding cassette domain-containing protein [Rhodospirillaceae bacterium]MBT6140057.1 ATP-binding cassette domain-containing protein [Rhodospirillaceae bacterium]
MRLALAILGSALLAAWGVGFAGPYEQQVLTIAGINALAVLGYQLVFGRLGALSLAQGIFFAVGAYATGLLATRWGLSFPVTFLVSILAPMLVALVVSIPVLRLGSHYFALATLGIAQLGTLVAVNWEDVTGGANGIYGVPEIAAFGQTVPVGSAMLVLVWGLVVFGVILFGLLTQGARGARLATLERSPLAAGAIGIDAGRTRLTLFLIGAGFAGAAGALQAHAVGVVSPAVARFDVMVAILAMAVIGGRGSALGAVLGAVLLTHLPEWFRAFESYYLIAYGVAVLATVILLPSGLAGLIRRTPARPPTRPPNWVATGPLAKSQTGFARPAGLARRPPATLTVAGAGKRFGGLIALEGVDLHISPGRIIGLIGPNGSGKTTLLNLISGLERADTGRVRLDAVDISGLPANHIARLGVARCFQHPDLPGELTAFEAVLAATPGDASAVDRAADSAADRAIGCLRELGIDMLASRRVSDLAAAEQRRLEIARALATQPRVLLLDEPAAGLGENERVDLARQLRQLAEGGLGILVVEHTMDFLLPLADRVVCLVAGRRVAEGEAAEVVRDPAAISAYFGEAPA